MNAVRSVNNPKPDAHAARPAANHPASVVEGAESQTVETAVRGVSRRSPGATVAKAAILSARTVSADRPQLLRQHRLYRLCLACSSQPS